MKLSLFTKKKLSPARSIRSGLPQSPDSPPLYGPWSLEAWIYRVRIAGELSGVVSVENLDLKFDAINI